MNRGRCCGRREFLARSGAGISTLVLTVPGCASIATTRVVPAGGVVRLSRAVYPSLGGARGHARLVVDDAGTIVDVLTVDDGFVALSPICTHLGCTVAVEGQRLICPCHGSTYGRDGRVLRGPAERPLRTFPVSVEADGTVVVRVEGDA